MSASSTFSLLYQIQTQGIEALDGIARKQQQINLETKYSSQNLKQFDELLKSTTSDGTRLAKALDDISKSGTNFAAIAKDVVANNRTMSQSYKDLARDSESAWKRTVQAQRVAAAESRAIAAENRQMATVAASALGISGGGISQGLGALAGGSGGALIGIGAAVGALTSLYNITKETADFAQRQQNMATRMGGTTDQSQMITRASQVLDINPEAATTAMRGLVRAIADGGTESKRGEQALKALGVSATALGNGLISPATALEQMFTRLNAIKDPLEKDKLAMDLFQRTGLNILPLAEGFDKLKTKIQDTGVIMDSDAIGKMVEYRQAVELLDLRWVALKEKLAEGAVATIKFVFPTALGGDQTPAGGEIQSILEHIIPGASSILGLARGYGAIKDPGPPDVSGLTDQKMPKGGFFYDQMFAGNKASADALLRSIDPKAYKSRGLADAQGDLDLAYSDRQKAVTGPQRTDAESRMRDAAARIAALSEKQGNASEFNALSRELDQASERAQYPSILYGNLGSILSQRTGMLDRISTGKNLTAAQRSALSRRVEANYSAEAITESQKVGNEQIIRGSQLDRADEKERSGVAKRVGNEFSIGAFGIGGEYLSDAKRGFDTDRALRGLANRGQADYLQRSFGKVGRMDEIGGRSTPNSTYAAEMDLAQKLYALNMQNAQLEDDTDRRKLEQAHAYYDLVKDQDQARIDRELKIAEIGRQQKEETRSFSEGLFTAGMSGQSGGVSQYLHNFGMGLATKAIGNASDAILPSFNKVFSLGKTGALGTQDKPSFLGQLAKGTPFDWSAEELKKHTDMVQTAAEKEKNQPLITSQGQLKDSIDALTRTLGGSAPSGGGARTGGASGSSGVFSGLSRILGAPGGTAPFLSGGSTSSGSGSLSDLIQDGLNIPLSATAGHSADVSAIASLVATQSANVAGGYSLAGTSSFGIPNGLSGGSAADGASGTAAFSKIGALGQLFGGAKLALTGHALQGIFTGKQDNGDGTGEAISGIGRVGEAAALAGGTFAGVKGAISGFSQGGGRGITKGLASSLATAGMFGGPAAPFLEAGAGILGIASSLFGDPVAQRQKAIDQALTNDQYVQPNAHNYSYSGSGGGVDFGADGLMRGGAKQAGYTVNVSAMDAKSLYDTLQRNGQAFGTNLAQSIGSSGVGALASEVSWHALHP